MAYRTIYRCLLQIDPTKVIIVYDTSSIGLLLVACDVMCDYDSSYEFNCVYVSYIHYEYAR